MYDENRMGSTADPRQFNLGDCRLRRTDDQPFVNDLGTQEACWRPRASYDAIEPSQRPIRKQAEAGGTSSIAMPPLEWHTAGRLERRRERASKPS
jgi:hypothetical protein